MNAEPPVVLEALSEELKERGLLNLPAHGFSMGGRLGAAKALRLESVQQRRPRLGDIVVFERDAVWVAHRWVARHPSGACLTAGDGVWRWDRELVQPGDILGVVTGFLGPRGLVSLGRPVWRWWGVFRARVKKVVAACLLKN